MIAKLTIPAGGALTIDKPDQFESIDVFGALTVRANIELAGNLNVREGGWLDLAESFVSFKPPSDFKYIGGDSDAARSDVGLWIEGKAFLTGRQKTSWLEVLPIESPRPYLFGTSIAACCTAVSPVLKLAGLPDGWQRGDVLLVITPMGDVKRTELVAVNGDAVTLLGLSAPVLALFAKGRAIYPRLINLTRSAGIVGGHMMALHHGQVEARFVELRDMGPNGILGRYSCHFHHTHHPSLIEDSSIWSTGAPGNRGIAIHDTPSNAVRRNVIYNRLGFGVFLEDPTGNEVGNEIVGNITAQISGNSLGDEIVPHPDSATYNKTSHYWVRPGNIVDDNIACGGTAVGFVNMPGRGGSDGIFDSCQAWGVGRYGFQSGTSCYLPDCVAINCDVSAYGSTERWGLSDAGTLIAEPLFLLNGQNPDAPFLTDTDRAYVSGIYCSGSNSLNVRGGLIAGKKGLHGHYTSRLRTIGTEYNVDIFCTPTYFDSDFLIEGGSITTNRVADPPYGRGEARVGRIRLVGVQYNGVLVDKTLVSSTVLQDCGLVSLLAIKDVKDSFSIHEIANLEPAGLVDFGPRVKYVRFRRSGQPAPTWWPAYYPPATAAALDASSPWQGYGRGLPPGDYVFELFDLAFNPIGTRTVRIKPGEVVASLL